jgi:hypothetical protein
VNKDRARLRIQLTRWNRSVGKQNDALARLRPTQAMAARSAFRCIYCDERVIRCTRAYYAPRCLCNFGGKRNDAKGRGFHERQVNPTPRVAHRRNSGTELCSRFPVGSAALMCVTSLVSRRPQGDGYNPARLCRLVVYRSKEFTTTRADSAIAAARSSAAALDPME